MAEVRQEFLDWAAAVALNDWLREAQTSTGEAILIGVRAAEEELRVSGLFDPRAQRFAEQFPYTALRNTNHQVAEGIRASILDGIRRGLNGRDLVPGLRQVFRASRFRLENIARTESNRAANHGRWSGWRQSGVVHEKRYDATLDDRVRESHLQADGEVVGINQTFTRGAAAGALMPPVEPMCRCTASPVTSLTEVDPRHEAAVERLLKERATAGACDVHRIGLEAAQESMTGLFRQEQRFEARLKRVMSSWESRLAQELESGNLTTPTQQVEAF